MYVRPCARRQGHSLALLRTLTSELPPGDHLGLSHPVSLSMCKGKFLERIINLYKFQTTFLYFRLYAECSVSHCIFSLCIQATLV